MSEPEHRARVVHTVPRAVKHAQEFLNDPSITDSQFRHWIADGKVRYRKFGGTYSFVIDELDQDLCGTAA